MLRSPIFFLILVVELPVLWLYLRRGKGTWRVSVVGFNPTSEAENTEKYRLVLASYRMQLCLLPVIALPIASFMDLAG